VLRVIRTYIVRVLSSNGREGRLLDLERLYEALPLAGELSYSLRRTQATLRLNALHSLANVQI